MHQRSGHGASGKRSYETDDRIAGCPGHRQCAQPDATGRRGAKCLGSRGRRFKSCRPTLSPDTVSPTTFPKVRAGPSRAGSLRFVSGDVCRMGAGRHRTAYRSARAARRRRWGWSRELGVEGLVESDRSRALIDGNDPVTDEPLLVGLRERTVKAFHLTFSAPKAVSSLWALGSEPVADTVVTAHREAVEIALGFLEERAAVARMQVDGVRRHVSTDGWAVAGFVHRTSRQGDRQLHTHCLVPNVVRRGLDGRCVALAARPLFVWGRAAGSIYQAELQRGAVAAAGGGVGAGPVQHPRAGRVHDGPVAGVLETGGRDRGRTGSPGRTLRVAGVADAGRRRGVPGHPAGQGPLAHRDDALWSMAGRGRSRRSGGGPDVGSAGVRAGPDRRCGSGAWMPAPCRRARRD